MKKIFAIFALCFAVFAANAQQFLLQESFDESTVPAGWATIVTLMALTFYLWMK